MKSSDRSTPNDENELRAEDISQSQARIVEPTMANNSDSVVTNLV
jgi:hypothetical protein